LKNLLAAQLAAIQQNETIFLEDESQRIGNLQIPMPLWNTMRKKEVYFFNIPFEERLNYLTAEYKIYAKEKLVNAIIRIQKKAWRTGNKKCDQSFIGRQPQGMLFAFC
jgi:tRNA 2-selenouridine synthase